MILITTLRTKDLEMSHGIRLLNGSLKRYLSVSSGRTDTLAINIIVTNSRREIKASSLGTRGWVMSFLGENLQLFKSLARGNRICAKL